MTMIPALQASRRYLGVAMSCSFPENQLTKNLLNLYRALTRSPYATFRIYFNIRY